MTVFEQAQKYLSAIPPAVSGQAGHTQTLNAARALKIGFNLADAEAMQLLQQWNQACQPPWNQKELEHKLREAENKPFDKPKGYLLTHRPIRAGAGRPATNAPGPAWRPDLPKVDYDLSEAKEIEMPKGKLDGFEQLLKACFRPGEGVRVMSGITEDGLVGCDSKGGVVLSQEEWLAKLEKYGDINGMYYRLGGKAVGVYLGVNPMKFDGRGRDTDVAVHRHCLIEFDKITLREQWLLYTKSNLPCAAIIYSGNKSLHAWVRIDAKDRKEYDERVNLVYNHFAKYVPDPHNKNPSRFSRCPDAKRGETVQYLLATNIGCESFTQWSKHLLVQGIGRTYDADEILDHNPQEDLMTVAGDQWLRKGGSAILVGPSGIGKSSLGYQMAYTWALGRPCFGVVPAGPLKVLLIQAENDLADLHLMGKGIAGGLKILDDRDARALLRRNLVTNHNVADTGHDFILAMQRLVDHHEPDLVMVDPLLSFIGDDISKQEVVGKFCRNWLNPILNNCQVAFMGIHHTAKPPSEKGKKGQRQRATLAEMSYGMMGSSELTNWARAIMILDPQRDNISYDLCFTKRGQRAGATHPNGDETRIVHLLHSHERIFWIQSDPPVEVATATETGEESPKIEAPKGPQAQRVAARNVHELLAMLPAEGWKYSDLEPKLITFASNQLGEDIKAGGSCGRVIKALIANHKLGKNEKGLYIKGANA